MSSDVGDPKTGALVMKLSGIGHVLPNVAQDYGGQNSMQVATCECSETSVRKYGLPCAHNIAHAEKAGMTAESIVHWKDITVVWKRQYAGLEFPVLSMFKIDSIDVINPMVQYPPVSPKPVRTGPDVARLVSGRVKPFCGACKKWGHTRASKRCKQYKKRGSEEGLNRKKITPGHV
jgi:hypothetical protein